MLNLVPLIGAVFLFLLFVLLNRFFVDWIALLATGTAGFNLVFWHFTRDTYSEVLAVLFLVLGLIAADTAIRLGSTRRWVLVGLLIGSIALVRVDAWFYIATLAAIVAVYSWMATSESTAPLRFRDAVAMLLSAWMVGAIGLADLALRSPGYLGDLWPRARLMLGVAIACGAILLAAVVLRAFVPRLVVGARTVWHRFERAIRVVGGLSVVAFAAWAYLWRPAYGVASGIQVPDVTVLMSMEGIPPDPTRSFYELSAQWISWYWGVFGLAIATLGWALAVGRRSLEGRRRLFVPLTLTGLTLLPYIIDPSITPDQLWAMRRFYPMALIGIAAAVGVVIALLDRLVAQSRIPRYGGLILLSGTIVALVTVPLAYAAPLARSSTQVGMYGSTKHLCENLPEDAAVLVEAGRIASVFPAAIRSFCDVPVAVLSRDATNAAIDDVGIAWKNEGRSLYLVGSPNSCILEADAIATSAFVFTLPEKTLLHRPAAVVDEGFAWELGRWDATPSEGDKSSRWRLEIQTTWAPPDSSSFIAVEGDRENARWWLEYRPSGLLEFWVNTDSGPMVVDLPTSLNDGRARSIPFGIDGDVIFIGCGADLRSLSAPGIVAPSGHIEIGQRYAGNFGTWAFVGEIAVEQGG
jgi:hypothetical protein